jgi:hypothetical protein
MQKSIASHLWKQAVKYAGRAWGYSIPRTRGVGQDILTGEHHDRLTAQETTVGKRNAEHIERIKEGYMELIGTLSRSLTDPLPTLDHSLLQPPCETLLNEVSCLFDEPNSSRGLGGDCEHDPRQSITHQTE